MPPCRLMRIFFWKFDYEMVHSEVYLNKYVVSIAPFPHPPFRKLLFFTCFRFLIFIHFFQGVCGYACTRSKSRHELETADRLRRHTFSVFVDFLVLAVDATSSEDYLVIILMLFVCTKCPWLREIVAILLFLIFDLLYGWLQGFPGLFTHTSELIRFYFLVFFPLFSSWFRAVD